MAWIVRFVTHLHMLPGGVAAFVNRLLLETGAGILLETGDSLILEG